MRKLAYQTVKLPEPMIVVEEITCPMEIILGLCRAPTVRCDLRCTISDLHALIGSNNYRLSFKVGNPNKPTQPLKSRGEQVAQ